MIFPSERGQKLWPLSSIICKYQAFLSVQLQFYLQKIQILIFIKIWVWVGYFLFANWAKSLIKIVRSSAHPQARSNLLIVTKWQKATVDGKWKTFRWSCSCWGFLSLHRQSSCCNASKLPAWPLETGSEPPVVLASARARNSAFSITMLLLQTKDAVNALLLTGKSQAVVPIYQLDWWLHAAFNGKLWSEGDAELRAIACLGWSLGTAQSQRCAGKALWLSCSAIPA